MKTIFSLTTLFVLLSFVHVSAQTTTRVFGDFNNDGKITAEDLTHMVNIILNKEVAPVISGDYSIRIPNDTPYLTFHAEGEQTLSMSKTIPTLEYSVNGGDWSELGTNIVKFGGEQGDLRVRGKSSIGTATSSYDNSMIKFSTSAKVNCSGDIRTLIDYEDYNSVNTENARFCYLFYNCTSLTSAPELPSNALATESYRYMFYGCTSLTSTPNLPATTLAANCYESMFANCSSLTSVPEELPATTLAPDCYNGMFNNCKSLVSAPKLNAMSLSKMCYGNMFYGCSSLVSAPELPATTLAPYCYAGMFDECTSLTSAPELPATIMAESCYWCMFYGCSQLSYIKMMAIDVSASGCLSSWTYGVATSGIFVKNVMATWGWIGESGVPRGWSVEYADEEDTNQMQ